MKLFSKNESEPERDEIEVRGGGGKSYPVALVAIGLVAREENRWRYSCQRGGEVKYWF